PTCPLPCPSAGPTNFAGSPQPSPRGMAAQLEPPRSRSAATLNVHARTPRAAASLGPRLARHLARHSAGTLELSPLLVGVALDGARPVRAGCAHRSLRRWSVPAEGGAREGAGRRAPVAPEARRV